MSEHNFKHREIGFGYEINPPLIGANAGLIDLFTTKTVERVKRNNDGFKRIIHRFPIKGGISPLEAMRLDFIESMSAPSPLFAIFSERANASA